jgi:acyl-CoA reductase-like NAD-dependent aldehyde dehydrogenase
VVILKINPVNDYIGPLIEDGFAALITRGFLKVVYGGSDVGVYLCNHPTVDEIHVTGSDKSFEAILFGHGPEATKRKNNQKPLLDKPLTGELGNISPVIIVPGDWSNDDIQFQAARIASWLSYNAGCN